MRIEHNLDDVLRRMSGRLDAVAVKQMPFALAVALSDTAKQAADDVKQKLPTVFDRPTPFTVRGIRFSRARKTDQPISAFVFVPPVQGRYLRVQVRGGTRRPAGRALLIPREARRNVYGNLPRGYIARMLARADTFSGVIGGVAGIWQRDRRSGRLKLLVAYAAEAKYQVRFPFRRMVLRSVQRRLMPNFRRAFERALSTAR